MTDEELFQLMNLNCKRYDAEKSILYEQYLLMDKYIQNGLEKNAQHRHFKKKTDMKIAMMQDCNPYNTFSYGKNGPKD